MRKNVEHFKFVLVKETVKIVLHSLQKKHEILKLMIIEKKVVQY